MSTPYPPLPEKGTSAPMPPYRAVMAVDAEKYSRFPSRHQQLLNGMVWSVLREGFVRSGLVDLWDAASFPQHTGDGYVVGVPTEHLPALIHPLLGRMQEVLAEAQPTLTQVDRNLRLRMRLSLGLGPLPDSGGVEYGDGVGSAMNETHRLLDAPALRRALDEADPDITLLVAALTDRVHTDAVLGGYTALAPGHFREIEVDLRAKDYKARGHLHIPQPSTGSGGVSWTEETPPEPAPNPAPTGATGRAASGGRRRGGPRRGVVFEPLPNRE
ncbi:hypothetical protein [Nocardiopsis sp. JB363]|uniref:hypothetical protein n=1 Tax=Nocardiopsis sp. JB363 TaxID=1434837 RepID=UPI00097A5CFD|nr:hypothetical protein [Nocardiopsis sp. JB363]SIO85575.1 hypothetical protein BQ8420_07645 [Nocardiopsis sp. JB363]